jgi:HD superfamily phosphodiesterase
MDKLILATERYARDCIAQKTDKFTIAHDFKHVDRVRKWALIIGKGEQFPDLEAVEIAAFLHDIGLSALPEGADRQFHGAIGAQMASSFLKLNSKLSDEKIFAITDAIRLHSCGIIEIAEHLRAHPKSSRLIEILLDADALDALGAVGLMRAYTSKYNLPDYDPEDIKGRGWGLTTKEFLAKPERGSVRYIVDQVNQQIRYFDTLRTATAKGVAAPLVRFMKDFVLQLEREITRTT